MEKGTCDFATPLFVRILEHMQKYPDTEGQWKDDRPEEGEMAGVYARLSFRSYANFSEIMSEFGEKYHPVGFPTEGGNGNYWNAPYYLVMNKESAHKEELKEYIALVFGEERQRGTDNPVRNGLISQYTVNFGGHWSYNKGDGNFYPLEAKPDGSSWGEEYQAVLNQCVARPVNLQDIKKSYQRKQKVILLAAKTCRRPWRSSRDAYSDTWMNRAVSGCLRICIA